MSKLLKEHGVEKTLELLTQEFYELDHKRQRVLELLREATSGLYLDKGHFPVGDGGRSFFFGTTHREYEFSVGKRLTSRLGKDSPETVVKSWLDKHGLAPVPGPPVERSLPTDFSTAELPVARDLTAEAEASIGWFKTVVEAAPARRISSTSPCALWLEFPWSLDGDTWSSDEWWREIARRGWEEGAESAGLTLIAMGEKEPEEQILERLRYYPNSFNEEFSEEVLWLLVERLPWPIHEEEDLSTRFDAALGPPPQLALFLSAAGAMSWRRGSPPMRSSTRGTSRRWQAAGSLRCCRSLETR